MFITTIQTREALRELEEGWRALYAALAEDTLYFTSWEFISTYLDFYAPPRWLVITVFAGEDRKVPIAIFPLEVLHLELDGDRFRICKSIGSSFSTYTDYLVAPEHRAQCIQAFLGALRQALPQCDALRIGPVHGTSANYLSLVESLLEAAVLKNRSVPFKLLSESNLPYIDARSIDFDELFASKKKSTLADARRCAKRLSESGKLEFLTASAEEDIAEPVRTLCRMHAEAFGENHFYGPMNRNWQEFVVLLAQRGAVEFSRLCLDGKTIAAHLGFLSKGRRYYSFPVYAREHERHSPSKVLLSCLIEKTFREKGVFCFGPGAYPYKQDWSQAIAETKSLWLFLTERGNAALPHRVSPLGLS